MLGHNGGCGQSHYSDPGSSPVQDLALSYNRPQISPKHISIDKIGQSSGTGVTTYDNDTIILISIL